MDVVLKGAILPVSLKMEDCACFEYVGDNDNCPRHAIVNHYTLGEEDDFLGRHVDPRTEKEKDMDGAWKDWQETVEDLIASTRQF